MMKIISIANQKGGVGKSTTSIQTGFGFAERGYRVVVIDLDPQANTSAALSDFPKLCSVAELIAGKEFEASQVGLSYVGTDRVSHVRAWGEKGAQTSFLDGLGRLEKAGCDLVVIDTAPALDEPLRAALLGSSHVLVPVKLELFSMMGLNELMPAIGRVKAVNPELNFLGMLPTMKDARTPRHKQLSDQLVEAYGRELVLPLSIGLRGSIAESSSTGVPLTQMKGSSSKKAAQEYHALCVWLGEKMGFDERKEASV